jgi:hypothetical protein
MQYRRSSGRTRSDDNGTEGSVSWEVLFPLAFLLGGSIFGGLVGHSLGGAPGAAIGVIVPVIAVTVWVSRKNAQMSARLEAAAPIVARIASLLESKWGEGPRPLFHARARLVRADGSLLGDCWLSPPPQFVELLKPETRLLVQWHPEHPNDVIVDWQGSVDLPDQRGYRS